MTRALVGGAGGGGQLLRNLGRAGGGVRTGAEIKNPPSAAHRSINHAGTARDFGACRDLSGRRLRHVNDEIALERWHQARARNEARKRDGGAAAEEDEDAPAHGIRGWHLAVPSWAELPTKARKSKAALRRAAAARRWQDEEAGRPRGGCVTRSFEGAVTMVDTVHDARVVDGAATCRPRRTPRTTTTGPRRRSASATS